MRKRCIGIIDLVSKGPTHALFARVMNANLASIMPQVIAVWCEQEGHDVTFVCYTGFENLVEELPDKVDLVFIGAFTEAAQLAYALSGPHARCYPQDAVQYFDYVLGFTDKTVIRDVLQDCAAHRPIGLHLTLTVLCGLGTQGPGVAVGVATRGGDVSRPQRLSQVGDGHAESHPEERHIRPQALTRWVCQT
jgi:hypothetical protein